MKKVILLLAVGLLSFSCSKDKGQESRDQEEAKVVTTQDIKGLWEVDYFIRLGKKEAPDCYSRATFDIRSTNAFLTFSREENGNCIQEAIQGVKYEYREGVLVFKDYVTKNFKGEEEKENITLFVEEVTQYYMKLKGNVDDDNGQNVVTVVLKRIK